MKYTNFIPTVRYVFIGLISLLMVLMIIGAPGIAVSALDIPKLPDLCQEDEFKDKDKCKYKAKAKATNEKCAKTSQTSFNWGTDCATVNSLLSVIAKTLAGLVGIAVVCGIVWGGMLYSTSNGNASKAQQGISFIINAVIGLLLFIFMFALANFLVPGGILG